MKVTVERGEPMQPEVFRAWVRALVRAAAEVKGISIPEPVSEEANDR